MQFIDLDLKDISFGKEKFEWDQNKLISKGSNCKTILKNTKIKLVYHWFPENYPIPEREYIRNLLKKKDFYTAKFYSYKIKQPILDYIEVYLADLDIEDSEAYLCYLQYNVPQYFQYVEEIFELENNKIVKYKI